MESEVWRSAARDRSPLLGMCREAQTLNVALGDTLRKVHGENSHEVNSFHLWAPEIIDEFSPHPEEDVTDKFGYSGFYITHLADALHAHGVTQVVVVGTVTQICVEDTVRGGFHQNFEMVVVEDAVASFDHELHNASLRGMAMKYARIVDSDVVLDAMRPVVNAISGRPL